MFHMEEPTSHEVELTVSLKNKDPEITGVMEYAVHEMRNNVMGNGSENVVVTTQRLHALIYPNMINTVSLPYDFRPGTVYKIEVTSIIEHLVGDDVRLNQDIIPQKTFRKSKFNFFQSSRNFQLFICGI